MKYLILLLLVSCSTTKYNELRDLDESKDADKIRKQYRDKYSKKEWHKEAYQVDSLNNLKIFKEDISSQYKAWCYVEGNKRSIIINPKVKQDVLRTIAGCLVLNNNKRFGAFE
jgi:hypothetical protein